MKKSYLIAAIAAASGLASCSNQELATVSATGEGTVSYTISLPSQLASRAYGEAAKVTDLYYAVYATGTTDVLIEKTLTNVFAPGDLTEDVTINLVTGKTYDLVFWAQANGAPYAYNTATQTITVNYSGIENGDETRDAFFAQVTGLKITGPMNETVELRRPFAQLNIGTDDLDKVFPAVTKAEVTVPVYDQLNLMTGAVSNSNGATDAQNVTFALAEFPDDEAFPIAKYDYMAMNYLLVNTRELVKVEMTTDDSTVDPLVYDNVPVQRNYRTNIYGSLLTTPTIFSVVIRPEFFEPDYDNFISVATPAEFVDALNAGETGIVLTEDIDLSEVPALKNGILANNTEMAIDLGDKTLDLGANRIWAYNTNSDVVIKNGTLVINTDKGGLYANSGGSIKAENVTIEDVGQVVASAAPGSSVKITDAIIKVEAPTDKKAIVAYSTGGDMELNNVTVDGGKLAFGKTAAANVTLTNVTATVEDGVQTENGATIVVEDCNITVNKPTARYPVCGVTVFDQCDVTVKNTTIFCPNGYGFSTNASNPLVVTALIEDCDITGKHAIMMNEPGFMTIKNTKLVGYEHGIIARGGTITFEGCDMSIDTDKAFTSVDNCQLNYDNYATNNWETGSGVQFSVLTIGNKNDDYQFPTSVTFTGENKLTVNGYGETVLPVIYAHANQGTGLGVTFDYPEATTTFNGLAPVYASSNITVNGTAIVP